MVVASGLRVRDVSDADELRACQALQRRAWGINEDGYVVPVATMAAAQKVGGLVLGAFEEKQLVGFAFAFLGRLRGKLVLYSQLTGVEPGRQGTGVGRLLKQEQRRRAREMGLDSVVWAFDPLQASNASFNLAVLGATSCTYEVDLYGSRSDALNAGLATDRLLAEWSTAEKRHPVDAALWSDAPDLIETAPVGSVELREPVAQRAPAGHRVRVALPADLSAAKAAGIAISWQLHVRNAFQTAFAAGYQAVGFVRSGQPAYLLERQA